MMQANCWFFYDYQVLISETLREIEIKVHCYRKTRRKCKKTLLWKWLNKSRLLCFNLRTKCRLLEVSTAPRYWVKLSDIFEDKSLFSQQKSVQKQLYRPKSGVNRHLSEVKTVKSAKHFTNYVNTNQNTEAI